MKLLEKKDLGNGLSLTIHDASRQVAGDRYNVKVTCLITLPVNDECFNGIPDSDEIKNKVKERIGDLIEFQIVKERSFVDKDAKDDLVTEMVEQINSNVGSYISSEHFTEKLFACRFDELRKKVSVPEADIVPNIDDDDEGPADFSSCFIDT